MSDYRVITTLGEGLVMLHHSEYGNQPWNLGKITGRRSSDPCAICGKPVGSQGWRPLTNRSNRMVRICTECLK